MSEEAYATLEWASKLTGLSQRLLRQWHTARIVAPQISAERPRGPFARLYSFVDLVSLRVLARVRGMAPDTELRKVQPWLNERSRTSWQELIIFVENGRLHIADGRDACGDVDDTAVEISLETVASELQSDIERLRQRSPADIGRITRHPSVMGNAWVISGTRIPTAAVWDFHDAGYDTQGIIEQYPRLTPEDVTAAIKHERDRQKGAA